jgi:hypothetical protein
MAKVTAQQAAAAWQSHLASAGERITAGVQATTVAPGQAAARQKAAYVANVQASADKWASRTAAVPLGDWQQAVIQKGVPRIAAGATAAQPKFEQFMGKLLPFQDSLKGTLPARGGLDQNITRMDAWVRGMAKFTK